MSFDPGCYRLAEAFLSDERKVFRTEANINRIAQRMQDVIEDEILCIKQDAEYAQIREEWNDHDRKSS